MVLGVETVFRSKRCCGNSEHVPIDDRCIATTGSSLWEIFIIVSRWARRVPCNTGSAPLKTCNKFSSAIAIIAGGIITVQIVVVSRTFVVFKVVVTSESYCTPETVGVG
jgi:hypothetical protein